MVSMDKDDLKGFVALLGFLLCIVAMFAFVIALNADDLKEEIKALRVDAVKRGYAEWKVDEKGNATWHWVEKKQ